MVQFIHIIMKLSKVLLAVAALICAPAAFSQADSTASLTLDQCIAIALDSSPTIKVADMEVSRMDYSRREVIGQLLPTVDFGATYSRMLAKQVMYMNMDFGYMGGGDGAEGDTPAPASDGA